MEDGDVGQEDAKTGPSFSELWTETLVQENKEEIERLVDNTKGKNVELGGFVIEALTLASSSYNDAERDLFVSSLAALSPNSAAQTGPSIHQQRRHSPLGQ